MKKIILALLAIFIIIQFFRPEKNLSNDQRYHIAEKYGIPSDVTLIMQGACNDCHSNLTQYPWYAEIQPGAWWLANHVEEGKEHLNFSEFTNRRIAWQNHKFEEIIEMVDEKEMPLPSYTWFGLHPEADLTDAQRQVLISWAQGQMALLQKQYPPDSLILRKR
jgi:hypothetical protein